MPPSAPDPKQMGYYFALAQLGLEMAAPVGLGWLLDNALGWFPWLTVIFTVLGLALGFTHLLLLLNRQEKSEPPKDKEP